MHYPVPSLTRYRRKTPRASRMAGEITTNLNLNEEFTTLRTGDLWKCGGIRTHALPLPPSSTLLLRRARTPLSKPSPETHSDCGGAFADVGGLKPPMLLMTIDRRTSPFGDYLVQSASLPAVRATTPRAFNRIRMSFSCPFASDRFKFPAISFCHTSFTLFAKHYTPSRFVSCLLTKPQ